MMKWKFKEEGDVLKTLGLLSKTNGLINSEWLALLHVEDSIRSIFELNVNPENINSKALSKLTLSVKTRNF